VSQRPRAGADRAPRPQAIAVVLVAAVGENGMIGRGNGLPWRLRSDLRHFRALTWGKPVVMGRKTFHSIGNPLKGRTTIVVSRDRHFCAPGILVAPGLEAALTTARGEALRRGVEAIVIAGGAEIYAQAMAVADQLAITHIHASPDGDTRFPEIDAATWREVERIPRLAGPEDEAAFDWVSYRRAACSGPRGERSI